MHIFSCNCYPEEDCEGGSGLSIADMHVASQNFYTYCLKVFYPTHFT